MRIDRVLFPLPFITVAFSLTCYGQNRPDFDASRLMTGTFHYRDHLEGTSDGHSVIRIEKISGGVTYAFSNVVTGSFSQHWRALTTKDFTPVSAELTFGNGAAAKKVFSLSYQTGHVTGFLVKEPRVADSVSRPVDDAVAPDTVDQRVDWASVMSLKEYIPSKRFLFHVYDPKTGNSAVEATVMSLETIHVDAGTFHVARIVYQIRKSTGSERFEVFVNDSLPRFLVKEVFPNGLISELAVNTP